MRRASVSALLLVAAALTACGYQLVRYRGALGDARTVAIRGVRNQTAEPGIDSLVTDAMIREFGRRGALRLVDEPDVADLVISGSVDRITTRGSSFSSIQFALEYEVTLAIGLEVQRRDGSLVSLDPRGLAESELYLSSPDLEITRKNRREALRRLASVLAGRVHDALFERLAP